MENSTSKFSINNSMNQQNIAKARKCDLETGKSWGQVIGFGSMFLGRIARHPPPCWTRRLGRWKSVYAAKSPWSCTSIYVHATYIYVHAYAYILAWCSDMHRLHYCASIIYTWHVINCLSPMVLSRLIPSDYKLDNSEKYSKRVCSKNHLSTVFDEECIKVYLRQEEYRNKNSQTFFNFIN